MLTLLSACATVSPDHVKPSQANYDSTTPKEYTVKQNSGILFLTDDGAVMTLDGKMYYDALCILYGEQIKKPPLKPGGGYVPYKDSHGNDLWYIDNQHLALYQVMSVWLADKRPTDSQTTNPISQFITNTKETITEKIKEIVK